MESYDGDDPAVEDALQVLFTAHVRIVWPGRAGGNGNQRDSAFVESRRVAGEVRIREVCLGMFPAPRSPRYESLDAWRGVACLAVVVFHSSLYVATRAHETRVIAQGGSAFDWAVVAAGRLWIGVPIFFAISGYCIAASADAARTRPGGVGRYFVRRARRIYPPLWVALTLGALFLVALPEGVRPGDTPDGVELVPAEFRPDPWQLAGNLTLTESWRPAVVGPKTSYVLGQCWTLCYEEQFYLVVGLLLVLAPRWFFPGVWLVTFLVVFNLSDLNPCPLRVAGTFTDGLWVAFAAGVAAYYRLNHAPPRLGAAIEGLLLALGLGFLASDPEPLGAAQTLGKLNAAACAFAVLLCRLRPSDAALASARWAAPLRFCGRMCYSLYLTHPLVAVPVAWACYRLGLVSPAATVLVTLPVCTLLSVGLGYAFYLAIEKRFLNTSPAPTPAEMAPATSALRPA